MSCPDNNKYNNPNNTPKSGSWIISKNPEIRIKEFSNSLRELGIYGPAKGCSLGRTK